MGAGGKGSGQTIGYRYYMTIHMGLSRGPIDELVEIKVGDKYAWPVPEGAKNEDKIRFGGFILSVNEFFDALKQGLLSNGFGLNDEVDTGEALELVRMQDDGVTNIVAPNLFGGEKKEGGISGSLTVCMGKPTQTFPAWVKTLMTGRVPDFRGVATLVFDGMICAMNPYPKPWKMRVRRALKGWDGPVWEPDLAVIEMTDGKIRSMNPAHILFEAATNRDWGRGFDRSRINTPVWRETAQTLFDEGMGLCMRWNRQDSLDKFVQEVISHIGGSLYTDRETGLLTLRLIRDDYDPNAIPLFDYNSGLLRIEDPETATQEDGINEVVVTYHDPLTDEDREVRAQNLAAIQAAGAPNSSKVSYSGFPTFELASRAAQRDLRASAIANRRFKVYFDRRAWRIYPGAVFRISAPDKGYQNLILRAGDIQDDASSGEIQVDCVIDVFGMPLSAFGAREESSWTPPPSTPSPSEHRLVREATWRDFTTRLGPGDLATVDPTAAALATMAVKPASTALAYNISSRTDGEEFVERSSEAWSPAVVIDDNIGPYTTVINFSDGYDLGLLEMGTIGQIGDEIVRLDDIDINENGVGGTITIARGCVDTVPAAHTTGEILFFFDNSLGTDGREYVSGEPVYVKMLTVMSSNTLEAELAPTDSVVMIARQAKPYPPANILVGGTPCFNNPVVNGDLTLTWSHRDRKLQADQLVSWNQPSVGPEAGTTYNIRVYSGVTLLQSFNDIAADSWVYNGSSLVGALTIEMESKRGGLVSLQKPRFNITRTV